MKYRTGREARGTWGQTGGRGVRRGLRFPPLQFLIEVASIERMSRRLRIKYPGAIYHIMARGNGRQDIVCDDHDRQRLMDELARCVTARRGRSSRL
jgi:hypothetical protein